MTRPCDAVANNKLKSSVSKLESQNKEQEMKTERLEAQSRRDNLRFYFIPAITTNFLTVKYKILYQATSVMFSISPSSTSHKTQ